jgi:hypothetical protein
LESWVAYAGGILPENLWPLRFRVCKLTQFASLLVRVVASQRDGLNSDPRLANFGKCWEKGEYYQRNCLHSDLELATKNIGKKFQVFHLSSYWKREQGK